MHGKVKLTKREIKEDKFATFMLTAKDQFTENWQYVAIGGAVLVLLVAAVSTTSHPSPRRNVEAAQKLATAQMDFRSGNTQVAIMSLNQIVDEVRRERPPEQALFLLGKVNFESKNYPEAIRYFEQFISKYGSDNFRSHPRSVESPRRSKIRGNSLKPPPSTQKPPPPGLADRPRENISLAPCAAISRSAKRRRRRPPSPI